MRPLVIGPEARAEAARVRVFAEAHHYHPGRLGCALPGNNPKHVARFGTYRAVFSITHADDMLYRHLSVSVPSKDYPNPVAVYMIADLFGFTGYRQDAPSEPGTGWLLHGNKPEHCIVVAQPIAADNAKVSVN